MTATARRQRSSVGTRGEERTAAVLDALADASTVVLHHLQAPGFGRGDLDHVVLRQTADGPAVIVIDSKCWSPGIYMPILGRTYRGLSRFTPAEHVTVTAAAQALADHLEPYGVRMLTPLVVVWPSRPGRITSLGLRLGDGTPWCRGEHLGIRLRRVLPAGSGEPVDPRLAAALSALRR